MPTQREQINEALLMGAAQISAGLMTEVLNLGKLQWSVDSILLGKVTEDPVETFEQVYNLICVPGLRAIQNLMSALATADGIDIPQYEQDAAMNAQREEFLRFIGEFLEEIKAGDHVQDALDRISLDAYEEDLGA
jgi:hypothetical protein